MTIALLQQGGVVALGYDSATNERGFLIKGINRTGHTSVKGELVSASTTADREFVLQANEFDSVGVVQEAGVAEASEMWIWVDGSVCQVLLKDTVAATRGEVLLAADTDGRATTTTNPGGGVPATETHFKENGHVLESKGAGTNVLVLALIHHN